MITQQELDLAQAIAKSTSKKWSAVDWEDTNSELVLWLFENEAKVERWRADGLGEGALVVTLKRLASKYCVKEQGAAQGAPIGWAMEYTTKQLERALPFMWEDTPQSVVQEHPQHSGMGLGLSGEYGMAVAIMTDIRAGFARLPGEMVEALTLRFRDGLSYSEMGQLTGVTDRGARNRVHRALVKLHELIEGDA